MEKSCQSSLRWVLFSNRCYRKLRVSQLLPLLLSMPHDCTAKAKVAVISPLLLSMPHDCTAKAKVTHRKGKSHLNSWCDFPEQRECETNGVLLSKSVHRHFHRRYGNHVTTDHFIEYAFILWVVGTGWLVYRQTYGDRRI